VIMRQALLSAASVVSVVSGRDRDKLPALLSRVIEDVDSSGLHGEVAQTDRDIFPFRHQHPRPKDEIRDAMHSKNAPG
jgi:hypothetical protein